jgi:hypothetical protein
LFNSTEGGENPAIAHIPSRGTRHYVRPWHPRIFFRF